MNGTTKIRGVDSAHEERGIFTVEKAFAVLELLSNRMTEMRASEIGAELAESRGNIHRLLKTMEGCGYVKQNPCTKKYSLSSRFLGLGFASCNRNNFLEKVSPTMMLFARKYNRTVILYMIESLSIYNAHTISPNALGLFHPSYVGVKLCPYSSAAGKLALAYCSERILNDYLENTTLTPFTSDTIISKSRLTEELEAVRKNGYAVARREASDNLCCLAFPIFNSNDQLFASISLACTPDRFSEIDTPECAEYMLNAIQGMKL